MKASIGVVQASLSSSKLEILLPFSTPLLKHPHLQIPFSRCAHFIVHSLYTSSCVLRSPLAFLSQHFLRSPSVFLPQHLLRLRRYGRLILQRHLPDVPAPPSENLDDFGGYGRGERDADEDEGLVDCVGESELGPYACRWEGVVS